MEKINLKDILDKHQRDNKTFFTSNEVHTCLNAMKEVWNLAVDKCKEASFVEPGEMRTILNHQSLEQVKKLII